MTEQVQQILAEFGRGIGLDGLALDANGYCCLGFDEVVVNIEWVPRSEQLMLYCHLGFAPAQAEAAWYRELLEANHFFRGTGGATLGVDPATQAVALVQPLALAALTPARLEAELQGFVDGAEAWVQRLRSPAALAVGGDFAMPMFQGLRA